MVQKGDSHYHCFGCGAHGDAIHFLMERQGYTFVEAIDSLALKFGVILERIESSEAKGPSKKEMCDLLLKATDLYHLWLLHTDKGQPALQYLHDRGIDVEFIKRYKIGLAPDQPQFLLRFLQKEHVSLELMKACGLVTDTAKGNLRDFFIDRITFPIHSPTGSVIGFSARKYKEETYGGKYINSVETPVFKKSHVLFGLNHSRPRIVKEKRVLIVEGQIDALRLIDNGLDLAVASLGTAFGQSHVDELIRLGIEQVHLLFDSDNAGNEAAVKVGNLFQKISIDVHVVTMPEGHDPDSYLKEKGIEALLELLEKAPDYLTFLVTYYTKKINLNSPAEKNQLIENLSTQIREWNSEIMVHESLKKLASLLDVPENMLTHSTNPFLSYRYKREHPVGDIYVNADQILEGDLILWYIKLFPSQDLLKPLAFLTESHFKDPFCRSIFIELSTALRSNAHLDLIKLLSYAETSEQQIFFTRLLKKKMNVEKKALYFPQAVQRLLDRKRIEEREEIRQKLHSSATSEEEALHLARQFDTLKQTPPFTLSIE
jgi:DNA primase, catalytic core